jgi:hypothetical protein
MKRFILLLIFIFALSGIVSTHKADAPEHVVRAWGVQDSKAYAKDKLLAWQENQYRCLDKLWTKESNWRPHAYNKIKVMGKNAGGIPQILGMSPKTPAPEQIDRGLAYIIHRYGTPCQAWKFHERKGWY